MKKLLFLSLLFSLAISANELNFNPHRVIVKLKDSKEMPQIQEAKKWKQLFDNVYSVTTDNALNLIPVLEKHPNVVYVEKDHRAQKRELAKISRLPKVINLKGRSPFNDPKINRQWGLQSKNENGVSVLDAYNFSRNPKTNEIIVAVVDTGVDYNHEDLRDVMWTNPGEIAGNGIDDDNNGYIDDIHGINTLVRDNDGNATVDMSDTHGHGTHVSGIIGAKQNNGIGIAGVASNVKIMGIRTVPNWGDELDVDVIEAFLYAAKNGAKIINCSFGKDNNEGGLAVSEAIEHIGKEYGTLVVAAAGNSSRDIDRRPTYPASFTNSNLLVVASTTSRGSLSYFTNTGANGVDIAGPGSRIYSTYRNNSYASLSGTSMASPMVAGVAAEILSRASHLAPEELKDLLFNSSTHDRRYEGRFVSEGRADLLNALKQNGLE